ncbi:PLP-dependent aspartate aminotransferase family protein [Streptomyces sp. RB6PN25]|uniref:PLP-dependent aspartate aminotransferase family protein n=1 Tax=Streptomyces humicola TaxID=2953240 RepID=A0ABT1PTX2_9ACTN|nr:PLP-dependent aspartate aminotransferase family protein [Streptomyces humicola]MCQ4080573.1 PLP-dependent aspartate aminotransferase family protein [Streptomyces humicola]
MSSADTRAVHAGRDDLVRLGVHVPPLDLSTTYPLPDVTTGGDSYEALATGGLPTAGGSHVYQRLWNPTVGRFEEALAELEECEQAVAFSSGMAALTACLLAAAAEGKRHVVAVRPLYGGSDHLLATGLLGTTVTWAQPGTIADALRPDTGLVIVETPGNPTLDLIDLADVARQAGDVPVLVDNTFATPVLQQPVRWGATLVLHSATKFIGGHGDVLAGAVATDATWASRLRQVRAVTGGILHPLAAYLLHRGLQTLPVRMRAASDTAGKLAAWLQAQPAVSAVHYPELPECDPLQLIGRQMSGPGAVLAFEMADGYDAAAKVAGACRLITHAVSLGGVDTLIQHPASLTHRPVAPDAKPQAAVLRLSVGLESPDDLRADLASALTAAVTACA